MKTLRLTSKARNYYTGIYTLHGVVSYLNVIGYRNMGGGGGGGIDLHLTVARAEQTRYWSLNRE